MCIRDRFPSGRRGWWTPPGGGPNRRDWPDGGPGGGPGGEPGGGPGGGDNGDDAPPPDDGDPGVQDEVSAALGVQPIRLRDLPQQYQDDIATIREQPDQLFLARARNDIDDPEAVDPEAVGEAYRPRVTAYFVPREEPRILPATDAVREFFIAR